MTKAKFTKQELEDYRRLLQGMVARLDKGVSELQKEALQPVGEEIASGSLSSSGNDLDVARRAADEVLALELLVPEQMVLADATDALARIDAGTFGHCEQCGRPIMKARLEALPYARQCIECARNSENRGPS